MLANLNLSVFGIPIYFVLAFIPHFYAVNIATKANNNHWQSDNPRSSTWHETLKKSIPAATYARYERAKAAHQNSIENLPLFTTAVILGNMARLHPHTLNGFVGLYLTLRTGHTLAYIRTTSKDRSFVRSCFFASSTLLVLGLIVVCGCELAVA